MKHHDVQLVLAAIIVCSLAALTFSACHGQVTWDVQDVPRPATP